jgi:hypothetical protein
MLGASTFAEHSIANQGILFFDSATMSGISSKSSVGVGILAGIASMNGNFTQSSNAIYITAGANADISSNFVQTTTDIKLVNEGTQSSAFTFTLTGAAIEVALGTSSQELSFTKSTQGDILYVAIVPEANETYTEITPSGTETWTEITPSGTETYTEINA